MLAGTLQGVISSSLARGDWMCREVDADRTARWILPPMEVWRNASRLSQCKKKRPHPSWRWMRASVSTFVTYRNSDTYAGETFVVPEQKVPFL